MSYRDLVERERKEYIGRACTYKGEPHTIVDVDYNGAIMIDLKSQFNDTTAIYKFDPDLVII